jgi:signal transduction histidine kinase/ActR/RegA family two-component response regulator
LFAVTSASAPNRTDEAVPKRAAQLVAEQSAKTARRTDRFFVWLFVFQWLACIAAVLLLAPTDEPLLPREQRLWWVTVVGAVNALVPLFAMWCWPGSFFSRQLIAIAQMIWAAMLFRATDGQIGAHFPIIGSIAILACYRNWRLLVTAALIVLLRDVARGTLWAANSAVMLQAWERLAFVLLEVASLSLLIRVAASQQWLSAFNQAHLEASNRRLDADFRGRAEAFRKYTVRLERARDELRQQAAELQKARAAAENANLAKSNLVATVSHEIRTPMTAILGYADVLIGSLQHAELLKAARTIRRNGEFLLQLVDDILDLSRIESGKLTVERIACSPRQVIAEVVQLMKVRADAKHLPLVVRIDDDVPETIVSDPLRLRQILLNLVSNAIKFSSHGEIRLEAGRSGTEDQPTLRFVVSDQGIGLTTRQIESLFQPFTQGDDTVSRLYGGSGMGLWISRQLANLLGGEILVRSAPGMGSTFVVTVASRSAAEHSEPQARLCYYKPVEVRPPLLKDRRVLVADDSPDNQALVEFVLTRAGAQVTVVDDGEDAVQAAFEAQQAGSGFDLFVLDVQMPRIDGFTAATRLRAAQISAPIVVLTAHAHPEELEQSRLSGCNACLTKPIDASLVDVLARLCGDIPKLPAPVA